MKQHKRVYTMDELMDAIDMHDRDWIVREIATGRLDCTFRLSDLRRFWRLIKAECGGMRSVASDPQLESPYEDEDEAEPEESFMCAICGAIGDYDFGQFVMTPDDPPSGIFEGSSDWLKYRYACPPCQKQESTIIAAPLEQARLRRLWWQGKATG